MKRKAQRHEPIPELKKALSMAPHDRVGHAPKGVVFSTERSFGGPNTYSKSDLKQFLTRNRKSK